MQVCCDASSGCLTEVESHVDPIRTVGQAKGRLDTLGKMHHLRCNGRGEGGERGLVDIGDDENVSAGVWKGVEAEVAVFALEENIPGPLGIRLRSSVLGGPTDGSDEVAEDASIVMGIGVESGGDSGAGASRGFGDVLVPPRCPKPIHCLSLFDCFFEFSLDFQRYQMVDFYGTCIHCGADLRLMGRPTTDIRSVTGNFNRSVIDSSTYKRYSFY